jgi:hypothetical protein
MKARFISVVAACLLVACGGGGGGDSGPKVCSGANTTPPALDADYASTFVGTWYGTATLSIDGVTQGSAPAYTHINADGVNKIRLKGDTGDGTLTLVTSPSTFSMVCSTYVHKIGSCAAVNETWSTGSGTLANGVLTLVADGFLEGCGEYYTVHQELTNAMRSVAAVPGAVSLDEALSRALEAGPSVR